MTDNLKLIGTVEDENLAIAIAVRAVGHQRDGDERDVLHHAMNIMAVHLNGNPLKLEELLAADDANFGHDVFGIDEQLDRNTGKLLDFFLPRFSVPVPIEGRAE